MGAAYSPASEQYAWLMGDLAGVDRGRTPWLIVSYHAPWYNSNYAHQASLAWAAGVAHACAAAALQTPPYAERRQDQAGESNSVDCRVLHALQSPDRGYERWHCRSVQGEGDGMRESMEALLYQHGVDFIFAG